MDIISYAKASSAYKLASLANAGLIDKANIEGSSILVPVGTTSTRPMLGAGESAIRFNSDIGGLEEWTGIEWRTVSANISAVNLKGTDTEANILAMVGMVAEDLWVASDTLDGWVYDGAVWINIGPLRGPQGIQGIQGIQGPVGNGIESVAKTDTVGLVDTYTVAFTDTTTTTFNVTNGLDGIDVDHISKTSGTGASGTTDVYTVWGDVAETINLGTFNVYNGLDGAGLVNSIVAGANITIDNTDPTNPVVSAVASSTVESINDLSDVDTLTIAPVKDNVLKWNGTSWIPGVAATTQITTPVITSPTTGTIDYLGPVTATYIPSDTYVGIQDYVKWEASTDENFANIIDSYEGSDNLTSWTPNISTLDLTTVYVRTKQGSDNHLSSWSDTISFTTPDIYVEKPTITVEGTPNDVPKNPTISGSAFSVMNGTDTHESTDYQVVRVSDGVVVWESLGNTVNKTSIKTGDLVESTAYIFKMRYKGTNFGYSQWVQTTGTTKAVFMVAYGVEWNSATDTYLRTGAASGVANSTSYAGAIQIQMRRCVLNANGTVKYYLHPTDSTKKADGTAAIINGTDGNVMVEIPKFWYKYEHVSGVHKWSISDGNHGPDYEVHPAFIRGGVEKDYRYYPAYEGFNLSGKLISGSGRTPTVSQTRAQFRTLAAANGAGWSQIDWNLLVAVQLLYLTEYANFNSQAMIGRGNDTGSDYTMTTGGSNSIGNASSPSTNNDMWMSYRGIENWYASMFKFIDGVNVQGRKYFINNKPATFADDVFTSDYVDNDITSIATNGYVSNLVPNKKGFVASAVAGSDSTYVPDYFYQSTGNRVVVFGGYAGRGRICGAFFLDASYVASAADVNIGSGVSF